jgi:SGNH hydrolase-like domain, acetyltransferase AlgX
MNSSDRRHKSYLKNLAFAALVPIALFCSLGFYLEPISGDLTRIGNLSERDFGWNAPQPELQVRATDRNLKPDVIVIGDSFSAGNYWQSIVMQKSGLQISTFNWLSLGHPSCIESWLDEVVREFPSAKTVIIQTIERSFYERFSAAKAVCKRVSAAPSTFLAKPTEVTRSQGVKEFMPDPLYAIKASIDSFKPFKQTTRRGGTTIEPLNRSDLFSHRRSDLLLYYAGDDDKTYWNENAKQASIALLSRLNANAKRNNIRLLIAGIPNKSTMYKPYFKAAKNAPPSPNIWDEMQNHGIPHINLYAQFSTKVASTRDFYLPNDSHLSTAGYLGMGEVIAQVLSEGRTKPPFFTN